MKTEVVMKREIFGKEIKQKSKSEFFSATDLERAGNAWRATNGLGLFDIRPESESVVLVGRRSNLVGIKENVRHQLRERNGIRVHSYDWLIDALTYSLHYIGLPTANRYLIQGTRAE